MTTSFDGYSREHLMLLRAQWVLMKHEQDFKDLMDCTEFNTCWPAGSEARQLLRQTREQSKRAWRQVCTENYPGEPF